MERLLLLLDNLDTGPGADRADALHGKASLLPKSGSALTKVRRHGPAWARVRAGLRSVAARFVCLCAFHC
jgi:hypothetical protein